MAFLRRALTRVGALIVASLVLPVATVAAASSPPASAGLAGSLAASLVSAGATAPAFVGGRAGACGPDGLVEAGSIDGGPLCTTGPEPGDRAPTGAVATPEATAGIRCYGTGTDGPRVQFVYAHTASVNHLPSLLSTITHRAGQMDAIFNGSARQTGGQRHIRFVTDANCNVDVDSVTVPASAIPASSFGALIESLVSKGYSDTDRKYVIWADTRAANPSLCTGLATLWYDNSPGAENWNNARTGFARLDETCLRTVFDGRTEAHELMHTLGAVQRPAPHASHNGHCTDEGDRMCYDDDGPGGVSMKSVCPASNELRFDCRNDDYFYVAAPCGAGGYLATHWNSADSRWLEATRGGARRAPSNDNVRSPATLTGRSGSVGGTNAGASAESGERAHDGKPGGRSVWFSWTAPVSESISFDTCGSDTDTLLAVYSGAASSVAALTPIAATDDDPVLGQQSRVSFTATAGTRYLIAVDGKSGDQGDIELRWGPARRAR